MSKNIFNENPNKHILQKPVQTSNNLMKFDNNFYKNLIKVVQKQLLRKDLVKNRVKNNKSCHI